MYTVEGGIHTVLYICITSVIYQNPYLEGTEASLDLVTQCLGVIGCSPPLHCFSVHRWGVGTHPLMYLHVCVFV